VFFRLNDVSNTNTMFSKNAFKTTIVFLSILFASFAFAQVQSDDNLLADGKPFVSWEKPLQFSKSYYVDQKHPKASDANAGTEKLPFKTVSAAARVLKAGERVVIRKGIYRESVHLAQGGASPDKMISYEAASGEEVVICGSVEVPETYFTKSQGWVFGKKSSDLNVWQIDMNPEWFVGYNPFGMTNLMSDTEWLDYKSTENCRITNNLFADITTARGGIYIEVSRRNCRVDHNVFYNIRSQYWLSGEYGAGGSALYTDGSDSINFDHNVTVNIENTGYGSYLNAERIVDMRGGISCDHRIEHNIFVDCRKHCIELPHNRNFSDNNLFINPNPAYIKVANTAPALMLDKESVNTLYNWEKNSRISKATYSFDATSNELKMLFDSNSTLPKGFEVDQHKLIFKDPRKK